MKAPTARSDPLPLIPNTPESLNIVDSTGPRSGGPTVGTKTLLGGGPLTVVDTDTLAAERAPHLKPVLRHSGASRGEPVGDFAVDGENAVDVRNGVAVTT